MKRMKKIVSILLAVVMVLGMSVTAFAADDGSITINGSKGNGQEGTEVTVSGKTFTAYQVLTAELVNGNDEKDGIVYRVPDALKVFYANYFDLPLSTNGDDENPQIVTAASFDQDVTEKIAALTAEDLQLLAEEVLKAAKAVNKIAEENTPEGANTVYPIIARSVTADEGAKDVTINGLPLGYYVVEDEGTATPISALALTTTSRNASVNIKASQPVIDKNIDGDNDTDPETEDLVKVNNTSVGDVVPYVVTSSVPDMTGYKNYYFIVRDTLSKGLTFNNDVAIYLSSIPDDVDSFGAEPLFTIDDSGKIVSDYYTVTAAPVMKDGVATGETAVEIVFKDFIQHKDLVGANIEIHYSATVNEDAVIGVAGNPNKVTLEYSNRPNIEPDSDPENPDKPNPNNPNPPTGVTPESITYTYVTGIELTKIDEHHNALSGAEFEITGTRINTVLVSKSDFVQADNGEYYKLIDGAYKDTYTKTEPVEDEIQTGPNGEETIVEGTSKLYEQNAAGYVKYNKVVSEEAVEKKEDVNVSATVDASGVLRFNGLAAGTYTITELKAPNGYNLLKDPIEVVITFTKPETGTTNCKWEAQITEANKVNDVSLVSTANVDSVGLISFDIQNMSGVLLPSTGGIGTTIFYVGGSILVLAAVVLLVTKKRMSHEK